MGTTLQEGCKFGVTSPHAAPGVARGHCEQPRPRLAACHNDAMTQARMNPNLKALVWILLGVLLAVVIIGAWPLMAILDSM